MTSLFLCSWGYLTAKEMVSGILKAKSYKYAEGSPVFKIRQEKLKNNMDNMGKIFIFIGLLFKEIKSSILSHCWGWGGSLYVYAL